MKADKPTMKNCKQQLYEASKKNMKLTVKM